MVIRYNHPDGLLIGLLFVEINNLDREREVQEFSMRKSSSYPIPECHLKWL